MCVIFDVFLFLLLLHPHVHLIFRRDGDMIDPAGGVRGVIPEKQKYFKKDNRQMDIEDVING